MEKIIKKISEIRNQKGFSYENMAHDLDLSVSAYRKIETGETKLTLERLTQISKVLETPINEIMELDAQKNFDQKNSDNATGFQGMDYRTYYDYSELSKKLITSYEKQIEELQTQVKDLKEQLILLKK